MKPISARTQLHGVLMLAGVIVWVANTTTIGLLPFVLLVAVWPAFHEPKLMLTDDDLEKLLGHA